MTIAGAVLGGALLVSGCKGDSYGYEVSGTVQEFLVDYDDCPGSLSMEPVGFDAGSHRSNFRSTDKKSDSSSSGSSRRPTATKTASPKSTSSPKAGQGAGSGSTATVKPSATKVSKGVKLSKKPDKPEKVNSVPKPAKKYKGCKTEYEIYVLDAKGDLYEQDVRKVDFDTCQNAEGEPKSFPECTIG